MYNILWVALMCSVALGLQAFLFGRFALRSIRYRRTVSRPALFAGEAMEMVEELENRKLLPIPWLRLESRMPSSFLFGKQQNFIVEGGHYHRSLFFMGPYRRITRRHTVRCLERGVYDLSSFAMTSGDLFGLKTVTRHHDAGPRVTVYPRLLSPDALALPSSRWQGELIVRRWIVPDPFLYNGIRDYRAGDALRDIHWRATAKTGQMQVMQRDFTASPRLMVLLNVQLEEHQWAQADARGAALIERAISLAATAALHAIENGVEAGVASNARVHGAPEDEMMLISPAGSPQQREMILDGLARLLPDRRVNFHTFLDSLPDVTGMDYLIVTPYRAPMIEQRADLLRARGNTAEVLAVEGDEPGTAL